VALTRDEKMVILELYGRGYSHSKISEKKEYSELTVRRVVQSAAKEVQGLNIIGTPVEQIATQQGYSLDFVKVAIEKYGTKLGRDKISKTDVKPEPVIEKREDITKLDIQADWAEFQRAAELEQYKELIQSGANGLLDVLKDMERDYVEAGVFNEGYRRQQNQIISEIKDFVCAKIDVVNSIEELQALEVILNDIEGRITALYKKYDAKIAETEKNRKRKAKKYSDKILENLIDIPLYPDWLKDFVKETFIVKNEREANIISDGMFEFGLVQTVMSKPKKEADEIWRAFIEIVKENGWEYVNRLARHYREREIPNILPSHSLYSCEGIDVFYCILLSLG